MKNIVVLGSTGSIGASTLEVVSSFPDLLRVIGLGVRENIELLREQAERFGPKLVAVSDRSRAEELRRSLAGKIEVAEGDEGIARLAAMEEADVVVSAMVGAAGLLPTCEAVRNGKRVALANKEVLVCGGEIVTSEARASGAEIMPIDSEHSALHQCLRAGRREEVRRVLLTASGGPFLHWPMERMERASLEEALRHPRWAMGEKVTIDSATMMNKTLEMIEARWLFGLEPEKIEVIVHPESIVHSMVEFADGSVVAQMSVTDMRVPIQYALLYPERIRAPWGYVSAESLGVLHFERPDEERFPALRLGRRALEGSGTMPAAMNAANEVAVEAFARGDIPFGRIIGLVEDVMDAHVVARASSLDEVMAADAWARREARRVM